jgi:hypothetical protein
MKMVSLVLAGAVALAAASSVASAASVLVSGSKPGDAAPFSASAECSFVDATHLQVLLTNTATTTENNGQLLEGVFWSSNSLGTVGTTAFLSGISKGSATIVGSDSGVYAFGLHDGGGGDTNNGKYQVAGSAWNFDFDKGPSNSHMLKLTATVTNDNSPNGPDGGLAAASTVSVGTTTFLKSSVIYTIQTTSFSAAQQDAFLKSITNVGFTYGTGSGDGTTYPGGPPVFTSTPPVPVPAAAWTGLSALAGLGLAEKLRKRLRRD